MFQQQLTKYKMSVLTFTATTIIFRSKYKVDRRQHPELNKNFATESAPIKTGKYIICSNLQRMFFILSKKLFSCSRYSNF